MFVRCYASRTRGRIRAGMNDLERLERYGDHTDRRLSARLYRAGLRRAVFARHALDNTLFRRREGFDLTDNVYLTVLQRRALVLDGMDSTAFLDSPDIPARILAADPKRRLHTVRLCHRTILADGRLVRLVAADPSPAVRRELATHMGRVKKTLQVLDCSKKGKFHAG